MPKNAYLDLDFFFLFQLGEALFCVEQLFQSSVFCFPVA